MSQIGMNLRVTESCDQGGRKYMEDRYAVHFERNDIGVVEFGYFGVFDGHGGAEAAKFARDHLLEEITKYKEFWTDDDDDVCQAIKAGFLDTHKAMWKEHDKWPRTSSGFASTSGTTASICFIKNCKLYVGHVGDSAIVLGRQNSPDATIEAIRLTQDHKPECPVERERIEKSGGCVMTKSGVNRVVWNRPKQAHQGPVRRSTHIDKIPFLAVARSLGDLWSYDFRTEEFVVSPEPDISVRHLFPKKDRCLVLGSDGLWNMLSPEEACLTVQCIEKEIEKKIVTDSTVPLNHWVNVSERLVNRALNKWRVRLMRADNTSALVVMIDPLGPSRWLHLRKKREEFMNLNNSRNLNNTINGKLLSPSLNMNPQESFCSRLDNITGCRKFSSSSLNLDQSLPLSPKSAIDGPEINGNDLDPMNEDDFDEVDGDMSIISNSSLPVIGSEIVIDSSKLITVSNDVRMGNGDLDDIEAAVMEENLSKNIKPPLNSKPTIPLLKSQHSFITFSGSVPASLIMDDSVCIETKPLTSSAFGTPGKLQKLKMKKLGGTPWKPRVHAPPESPLKIDPVTGRPRVKIIREYLTNPPTPPNKERPCLGPSPLLPGKPGDKVEIVREYLMKKDPEDIIKVKLPSKPSHSQTPDLPIVSKTKKFNVTIIREYLLKKKKQQRKKKKKQSSSMSNFHNGHLQFLGEVSLPSSSTARHSWTKWFKGRRNVRKSLGYKDPNKTDKKLSNSAPCSSINGLSEVNGNSSSSLPRADLTEEPLDKADNSDMSSSKQQESYHRQRSASLDSVLMSQVLKIKNCDQNEFSTMKTRNSPKGFVAAANCVDSSFEIKTRRMCSTAADRSPQLTGKEQIERKSGKKKSTATIQNSKLFTDGIKERKTPCEARQNLTRTRFNNEISNVRTRSNSDSTPVRVLRSLIGMKRKATDLPADRLNVKRSRQSSRGRTS